MQEILADFSNRQLNITESWENWTSVIEETRKTERIIDEIMSKNELVSATDFPYLFQFIKMWSVFCFQVHKKKYMWIEANAMKVKKEIKLNEKKTGKNNK